MRKLASRSGFAVAAFVAVGLALSACAPAQPSDSQTASTVPAAEDLGDGALLHPGATLGIYEVDGDDLVGDVDPDYLARWNRFVELFPTKTRPEVTLFVAMDGAASDADGIMHVLPSEPDKRWLGLDVTGDLGPGLDRKIIHEYGHLLTLRSSQVPTDPDNVADCPVYAQEGCPLPDSYIYAFESTFWPEVVCDDFDNDPAAAADRFATGDYITKYAATNPEEDIAEVFASWMLNEGDPEPGSVLEQKLTFFDAYPEVVQLKADTQAAING